MEENKDEFLDVFEGNATDANQPVDNTVTEESVEGSIPTDIPVQTESEVPVYEAPVETKLEEPVAQTEVTNIESAEVPTYEAPVEQEVAPVAPVEDAEETVVQDTAVAPVKTDVEVNEHPDAKIELNKETEETVQTEVSTQKGDYKALKFAIIIGIIILAAIIILPKIIANYMI